MKILFLLIVIMLGCSGCTANQKPDDNTKMLGGEKNEEIVVEDNVKNSEVLLESCSDETKISSSKTIEVKMINNSEQDILTGDAYKIEIFSNNEWLEIPIDTSYEDVAYSISAGEEKHFICMLEGISESGLYRIKKSYSIENKEGEYLTEYVYTEFQIKNPL